MYSYSIHSTNLSVIILPSCCNKFSRDFLFNPKDSFYAAKKNLIFTCPFCKTAFPNVSKVFNALSILNVNVGKHNSYILSKKKKGFTITLPTSGSIYNYLDEIISFEKLFKDITIENVDENDYEEYFYNLISFLPNKKNIVAVNRKILPLNEVSVHCKKCETSFDLIDKMEIKNNITCEDCNNHVTVPNKYLKEILSAHTRFQNVLSEVITEKITVIPFSIFGMYKSYTGGDYKIFKILNKQNVV